MKHPPRRGLDQWRFDEAPDSGRMVYIYKPPGWSADREERFPVLDGLGSYGHGIGMRVDRVVDHLVRSGRIPPIVVVLVDLEQDGEATRYRSTGEFVAHRLLPMLQEHYRATGDPDRVAVSGTSRRGIVASLVALRHPDAVRNVLFNGVHSELSWQDELASGLVQLLGGS